MKLLTIAMLIAGKPVFQFDHAGTPHVLVEGDIDYTLQVCNKTGGRIEVVGSVDGLSVMNGQLAGLNNPTGGYLVSAFSCIVVPGYRLDDYSVAAFHLGPVDRSYSHLMGMPTDTGVIGFRAYSEAFPVAYRGRGVTRGGGESTRGLGTEFGTRQGHEVLPVDFKRGDFITQEVLHYNDLDGYNAAGIPVPSEAKRPQPDKAKDPFPGDNTGATPPPGWEG